MYRTKIAKISDYFTKFASKKEITKKDLSAMMRRATFILLFIMTGVLSMTAQDEKKPIFKELLSRFTFHGYGMVGWEYHDKSKPNNEFSVNKLILMSDFRITDRWHAFAMGDFYKFSLHELWMSYRFADALTVKAGQFKTPFSLENPISPSTLELITLTSLATNYMICGSSPFMMPGGAGRDIGISVYGDLLNRRLSYDLAVMNGSGRNNRDNNSQKDFVGKLTVRPIPQLALSGSVILGTGNVKVIPAENEVGYVCEAAPEVTGIKPNGNFSRNRYAAGAELKTAPVNVRAEYMWGKDADLKTDGGYITAQVNNVAVKHLDVVASFDHLNAHNGITNRYSAGLQYWFFGKCRVQAGYSYTKHPDQSGENGILTQLQVAF